MGRLGGLTGKDQTAAAFFAVIFSGMRTHAVLHWQCQQRKSRSMALCATIAFALVSYACPAGQEPALLVRERCIAVLVGVRALRRCGQRFCVDLLLASLPSACRVWACASCVRSVGRF